MGLLTLFQATDRHRERPRLAIGSYGRSGVVQQRRKSIGRELKCFWAATSTAPPLGAATPPLARTTCLSLVLRLAVLGRLGLGLLVLPSSCVLFLLFASHMVAYSAAPSGP
jgi:hypothetical protein